MSEHTTIIDDTAAAPAPSSRRRLLRLAGGAAAGAIGAAALADRAAAVDGITITAGSATTTANQTMVTYSGATNTVYGFMFRGPSVSTNNDTTDGNGVLGVVCNSVGTAIVGLHQGTGGGVLGVSSTGIGVTGVGGLGADALGTETAIRLGAVLPNSNHIRFSNTPIGTPHQRATSSLAGTITAFSNNASIETWACVQGGTPGTWRKMVGPTTAGAFHPIATSRAYDSRKDMAPDDDGVLATGGNRVVFVGDKRDPLTGAVTLADVVPEHATAVAYNLTVISTSGTNGFLSVEPADAASAGGSAINWATGGLVLANASVAKLGLDRGLKVFCGGAGTSTHFIIDIVGYYM